jgi:hypothetical protein
LAFSPLSSSLKVALVYPWLPLTLFVSLNSSLEAFFEVLGGAQMAITFASRQPKGERIRSTSLDIEPQTVSPTTLISGEISIGGTIKF